MRMRFRRPAHRKYAANAARGLRIFQIRLMFSESAPGHGRLIGNHDNVGMELKNRSGNSGSNRSVQGFFENFGFVAAADKENAQKTSNGRKNIVPPLTLFCTTRKTEFESGESNHIRPSRS